MAQAQPRFLDSLLRPHLDTVVKREAKRRYLAFAEATVLYYEQLRASGLVFSLVFTRDPSFTLALRRDGDDGRTMLTVESIAETCEHGDKLEASDQLLMIYDCLIVEPSREDFVNLVDRIDKAMRPIKFTFARGQGQGNKLDMYESSSGEVARRCAEARKSVFQEAERAAQVRAAYQRDRDAAAMAAARLAAAPYFAEDARAAEAVRRRSRERADAWRFEASELFSMHDDTDTFAVAPEPPCADLIVPGAIVRVLDAASEGDTPQGRLGTVIRVDDAVATVRFSDAPLNRSFADHPAVVASGGLRQSWRGRRACLELVATALNEKGAATGKIVNSATDFFDATSRAAATRHDQVQQKRHRVEPLASSSSAAADTWKSTVIDLGNATIPPHAEKQRHRRAARGKLPTTDDRDREASQRCAIDGMERERRRQVWRHSWTHPGCGSFVHFYGMSTDDQARSVSLTALGLRALTGIMSFNTTSRHHPSSSIQKILTIEGELRNQRHELRAAEEPSDL